VSSRQNSRRKGNRCLIVEPCKYANALRRGAMQFGDKRRATMTLWWRDRVISGLLAILALSAGAAAPVAARAQNTMPVAETKAEKGARMHWWRQARFGMFIHWGLYAVPAGIYKGKPVGGIGEWIMHEGKIPVSVYADYARQFNPTRFDADTWVRIAKAAGMKYIVMTAKHHDGFAMYHTTVDSYNIYDATPFKRDPIAEMAAACKRQGIRFGIYYSQSQDWHHRGGGSFGGHWDPAQDGDYDTYLKTVAQPQLRELLTKYHPAVLWFDTPVDMTPARVAPFEALLGLDPGVIVNNRLGGGFRGDTETPEQTIPPTGFPGRDWETCMTINDTWGYKRDDTNFKSTATLLHNLIDIASKGGNYLLNVGPDATGKIPQPEVDRLEQIGQWLQRNGEAIYGASASPYKRLPFDGRSTVKGNTLYLTVFQWPETGLTLPGVQTAPVSATALATGKRLAIRRLPDGLLTLGKPDRLDPIATVIKLHFSAAPVIFEPKIFVARQPDGSYTLKAAEAALDGATAQFEGSGPGDIGYWTNASDTVHWALKVPSAGAYQVQLEYACDPSSAGGSYKITVDGAPTAVQGTIEKTGGWQEYTMITLPGTLNLPAGHPVVRVTPLAIPNGALMNLRRITLRPASKN